MNLTSIQKAAIITAMQKAAKSALDDVREAADKELRDLYMNFSTDRVKVTLGDAEIGVFSLTFSKDEYAVVDEDAFNDFLLAQGLAETHKSIKAAHMQEAVKLLEDADPEGIEEHVLISKDASKYMKRVGDAFFLEGTTEIVPGIVPAPKVVTGSRLTGCKPNEVLPMLNSLPGGVDALLLGGGLDD